MSKYIEKAHKMYRKEKTTNSEAKFWSTDMKTTGNTKRI